MHQNYFRRFLRILIMLIIAGLIIISAVLVWQGFHKVPSAPGETAISTPTPVSEATPEQTREQQLQTVNAIRAALPSTDQKGVSDDQLRAEQIKQLNELGKAQGGV